MTELGERVKTNYLSPHIEIIEVRESIMASASILLPAIVFLIGFLAKDSEERPVFLLV